MMLDKDHALLVEFERHVAETGNPLSFGVECPVVPVAIDLVSMSVRDLARSIAFYRRVFGLHVTEDGRDTRQPYVIMSSSGRTVPAVQLALHEEPQLNRDAAAASPVDWRFVVGDLDRTHADLWNLGVAVCRDNADGEPGEGEAHVSLQQRAAERSLRIQDPDGYSIELTDRAGWLSSS
jgi:catechol 2,3-dioxygenase-like lactoylglutathione lyase family enzyme